MPVTGEFVEQVGYVFPGFRCATCAGGPYCVDYRLMNDRSGEVATAAVPRRDVFGQGGVGQ